MVGSDPSVTFYLGLGSRYSYLAATQLDSLSQRTGAIFEWRPIKSSLLTASHDVAPFQWDDKTQDWWGARVSGQYKESYRRDDLSRWAAFYGVPYQNPKPPAMDAERRTLYCVAACLMDQGPNYTSAMFERMYADGIAISEEDCLAIAGEVGLDPQRLAAGVDDGSASATHAAWIEQAHALGLFGVPTFHYEDQLFWGNDRLVLLEAALLR